MRKIHAPIFVADDGNRFVVPGIEIAADKVNDLGERLQVEINATIFAAQYGLTIQTPWQSVVIDNEGVLQSPAAVLSDFVAGGTKYTIFVVGGPILKARMH
jgi:uncharacterized protein YaaW (UPF0174 family)